MSRSKQKQSAGSPVYQANHVMDELTVLGISRHQQKAEGTAGSLIVGIETRRAYHNALVTYGRWLRAAHSVPALAQSTPDLVVAYIHHRMATRAPGTVGKDLAAIRHLDEALRRMGRRPADAPPLAPTGDDEYAIQCRHSSPRPTPLTPAHADGVAEKLRGVIDPVFAQLNGVQRYGGLRLAEAVHLRADAIAEDGSSISLRHNDHTKGGRPRVIPIEPQHRAFFMELRAQGLLNRSRRHDPEGHCFDGRGGLDDAYRRKFQWACRKVGAPHTRTHDMRATYADELLRLLIAQGCAPEEARLEISRRMGHNRPDVLRHYVGADSLDHIETEDDDD